MEPVRGRNRDRSMIHTLSSPTTREALVGQKSPGDVNAALPADTKQTRDVCQALLTLVPDD